MARREVNKSSVENILVLIPTYNEKDNVKTVISQVFAVAKKKLPGKKLEILIIDDNSPDGTEKIVREMQRSYAGLHLISGKKAGLGKAYLRGFRWALQRADYDALVMMDADLSHDPAVIPSLILELDRGADYVIGSRYVSGGSVPSDWPIWRVLNSRVANNLARFLSGIGRDVADVTGGFKAIRMSALKSINLAKIDASGYFIQVSLLYSFWRQGFKVKEIPIAFADRRAGSSKLGLKDILEFLYRAYRLNPSSHARQLVRFACVGATGTIVNLLVLHFLIRSGGLNSLAAVAIAIEASIISNFFMNHYYTFHFDQNGMARTRHQGRMIKRLGRFNIGMLTGAGIQFSVFALLHVLAGIHYILADIIAIVAAMGFNYLFSAKFVWNASDS